jgi:hypothetical protein
MSELDAGTSALEGPAEDEEASLANGAAARADSARGQAAAGSMAGEGTDEGGEGEDVVDFEPGQLGSAEMRTLAAAKRLSEVAGKVLKSISKPLLQGTHGMHVATNSLASRLTSEIRV